MGCCTSSPHARRRYRDPADLDELWVPEGQEPLRTFGLYRNNGVQVPDDIDGLPSSRLIHKLATNPDILLYEAEIDHGMAWRCLRPVWIIFGLVPPLWPAALGCLQAGMCSCDEIPCWVRKEYATRRYYRVYPNRIEINSPHARIPFGYLGCGSWNGDAVLAHPLDRGAFGFRRVAVAPTQWLLCVPLWGDTVARQRCQCNGPPWGAGVTRGWWCDEWCCDMLCCSYRYHGLANGDEVAAASNLALQAYYEGRPITRADMDAALDYWRQNVSEEHSPKERKRPVVCEDKCCIPCCCTGSLCYTKVYQCRRKIPPHLEATPEIRQVYDNYETLRKRQIRRYREFKAPLQLSTCCKALGCQRCCGRKGVCFCTEGCHPQTTVGCCYGHVKNDGRQDPFPPSVHQDWDDDNDAARIWETVCGNPPPNVEYKRWTYDEANSEYRVEILRAINASNGMATNNNNNNSNNSIALEMVTSNEDDLELTLKNGTTDIELAVPKDA